MKKTLLLCCFAILFIFQSYAQCPTGQVLVTVTLKTDSYPNETTWTLKDRYGNVLKSNVTGMAQGTVYTSTVCVNANACMTFHIGDSYGDGICCGWGNGYVNVDVNGSNVLSNNGQYGNGYDFTFNCGPGESCTTAIPVTTGTYTASGPEYFYKFKPTQVGLYEVSMCGLPNTCDTKIWVYENCLAPITNNNAGTILYNDDYCNLLSQVGGALDTAKTYIVRIGAFDNANCSSSISFAINYVGQISGCIDPNACNYNPLATLSDSSCRYYPDPLCPSPDLTIDEPQFKASLSLDSIFAPVGDCMVAEGCLNGYGERTIIRFDTYIKNIGDQDYYIGNPNLFPGQFSFNNCHGHAHYEGYAEYRLYKQNGQAIPIGFKNGFCVLDFDGCPGGGTAKFSCGNMGITAGCGDIYYSGLDCQWIDITDVDTGQYILATKVNWDQSPDALGHVEKTYTNNWAQACIQIYEINGVKHYTLTPNCAPYTDCMGVQFGNAVVDCNGTCNGTTKMGDLNTNGQQQISDAHQYVNEILAGTISPTPCNDLNATNSLTVWDAALMVNCALNGAPNNTRCTFPRGTTNPNHTATFSIANVNFSQNYFDVLVQNPTSRIMAYEFDLSGVSLLNVVNLVPVGDYPENPQFIAGGSKVICLSYTDSTIPKSNQPQPLCRVYYSSVQPNFCISAVTEVVNKQYEAINKALTNNCILTAGLSPVLDAEHYFSVVPNPASDRVEFTGSFKNGKDATIEIRDLSGRLVYSDRRNLDGVFSYAVDVSQFRNGMYMVSIQSASGRANRPLIITR